MQVTQPITPEVLQWILAQARAGHPPDTVLESLCSSGWRRDTAIVAIERVRAQLEAEQASDAAAPVPVPEPDLADAPSTLWAGDREVQVVMHLRNPRVVVFGGLVAPEECDELIALARPRLARSETVETRTGGSEVNEARTSIGMFFERGEHPLIARIEQRLATLLQWPLENGEGLQVLNYGPGAEYKPHYDYFDPTQPGTPNILARGGQRVASIVMYLNTPDRGGGTTFPDAALEVAPIKGNAVFFSYDRPHPETRSLHGGAPVLAGEKWVATKWLRVGRFT
jgi:prolyl 4-hydroxylase